jgi:acyl CoA:acetate/3-ketoacid CoA transferase alpha subunit
MPRVLLRVEGAVVFAAATALYFHGDHAWWLYLALALVPDLSMIGYAAGTRVGALAYNAAHTYALPVALAAAGVLADVDGLVAVGLIWIAHIGADRTLGYGLKYPTAFKDTHLQRV